MALHTGESCNCHFGSDIDKLEEQLVSLNLDKGDTGIENDQLFENKDNGQLLCSDLLKSNALKVSAIDSATESCFKNENSEVEPKHRCSLDKCKSKEDLDKTSDFVKCSEAKFVSNSITMKKESTDALDNFRARSLRDLTSSLSVLQITQNSDKNLCSQKTTHSDDKPLIYERGVDKPSHDTSGIHRFTPFSMKASEKYKMCNQSRYFVQPSETNNTSSSPIIRPVVEWQNSNFTTSGRVTIEQVARSPDSEDSGIGSSPSDNFVLSQQNVDACLMMPALTRTTTRNYNSEVRHVEIKKIFDTLSNFQEQDKECIFNQYQEENCLNDEEICLNDEEEDLLNDIMTYMTHESDNNSNCVVTDIVTCPKDAETQPKNPSTVIHSKGTEIENSTSINCSYTGNESSKCVTSDLINSENKGTKDFSPLSDVVNRVSKTNFSAVNPITTTATNSVNSATCSTTKGLTTVLIPGSPNKNREFSIIVSHKSKGSMNFPSTDTINVTTKTKGANLVPVTPFAVSAEIASSSSCVSTTAYPKSREITTSNTVSTSTMNTSCAVNTIVHHRSKETKNLPSITPVSSVAATTTVTANNYTSPTPFATGSTFNSNMPKCTQPIFLVSVHPQASLTINNVGGSVVVVPPQQYPNKLQLRSTFHRPVAQTSVTNVGGPVAGAPGCSHASHSLNTLFRPIRPKINKNRSHALAREALQSDLDQTVKLRYQRLLFNRYRGRHAAIRVKDTANGRTNLHHAVLRTNPEVHTNELVYSLVEIHLSLSRGNSSLIGDVSAINYRDKHGKTARDYALDQGNKLLADYLETFEEK